jgi:hypothetical protein
MLTLLHESVFRVYLINSLIIYNQIPFIKDKYKRALKTLEVKGRDVYRRNKENTT